jgi:hypothetical protein
MPRTITPNQAAMLRARLHEAGIRGDTAQLDWIYEHGINVDRVEDIWMHQFDKLLKEIPDA